VFPAFVRGAGMFADSGATLPLGIGTVTPQAVAGAVVRAILTHKAEITVAPVTLRLGAFLGALAPGPSAAIQARFGTRLAGQLIAAQRDKR
jgi:hypothetical protein